MATEDLEMTIIREDCRVDLPNFRPGEFPYGYSFSIIEFFIFENIKWKIYCVSFTDLANKFLAALLAFQNQIDNLGIRSQIQEGRDKQRHHFLKLTFLRGMQYPPKVA